MAFGQPFYNYGTNPYGGQNNGYMAQQPQYGNLYAQPQNMAQNANNGVTQQYQAQQQAIPPKSNMILVASLMDAMSRTAEPNTDTIYVDQDKPYLYRVTIDMQGRKTYKTFEIKDVTEQTAQQPSDSVAPSIDLSGYAKKEDLQALKDEIMGMASAFIAQQAVQPMQPVQPIIKAKSVEKPKADKE